MGGVVISLTPLDSGNYLSVKSGKRVILATPPPPPNIGRLHLSFLPNIDKKEIPPTLGKIREGNNIVINSYIKPPGMFTLLKNSSRIDLGILIMPHPLHPPTHPSIYTARLKQKKPNINFTFRAFHKHPMDQHLT